MSSYQNDYINLQNEEEIENIVKILHHNNVAYGMRVNGYYAILGGDTPPKEVNQYYDVSSFNKKTNILLIEEDCISFSEIGNYRLAYNDIKLCDELENDIKNLMKYSFCFHQDGESYFFPEIKLVIWNNGSYSMITIYEYHCYDGILSDKECKIINNLEKYEKGTII